MNTALFNDELANILETAVPVECSKPLDLPRPICFILEADPAFSVPLEDVASL